jgi:hypothetical protein
LLRDALVWWWWWWCAEDPEHAFSVYQRMVAAQLTPTVIAYRALFELARRSGDQEKLTSK